MQERISRKEVLENMKTKEPKHSPIKLLLKWAKQDRIYLYMSVLLSFISGLCSIIPYYCIFHILDMTLQKIGTAQDYYTTCAFLVATILIRVLLMGASGISSHKGAYNTLFTVRCMVTEHMSKIPLGALNEHSSGHIKSVLNEQIERLELFLAHQLPELVYYLTGPLAIFIYLMTVNVKLGLISLIPLFLGFALLIVIFATMAGMMGDATKAVSSLNSVIIEYISGMRLIKAYNMTNHSFQKYSDAINEENQVWNIMSKRMGPPFAIFVVMIESGILLMLPIGGYMFLHGSITASVFLLFAFVGSLYLTEIRPMQELGTNFAQVLTAITEVKKILDIPTFDGGVSFPKNHDICMKNVSFSYEKGTVTLHDCYLHIAQGELLAMVGPSGAGKSTLVQLISRFYDVNDGKITIGGVNIKDINYEELLQNISIVFQKTFLTRDSVFENIRLGSNATLEHVREAAKKAQIDDFIMSLPEQYDTKVGSYSSRFSGGEKQRIAIARAILKNAPILILDEATSATDPENQAQIDQAIHNLCAGKTVLIVAHRLGTVKLCNKVAVVDNHTISCLGTHEEVLAQSKYYRHAWHDYSEARSITYHVKEGVTNE